MPFADLRSPPPRDIPSKALNADFAFDFADMLSSSSSGTMSLCNEEREREFTHELTTSISHSTEGKGSIALTFHPQPPPGRYRHPQFGAAAGDCDLRHCG